MSAGGTSAPATGARAGYGLILLAVGLFSTVEVLAKWVGPGMTPLRLAFVRFLVAGLALLPPALAARRRSGRRLGRRDLLVLAGLGAVGVTVSIGLFHVAIARYLPANVAAIVFCANPVFVAFLAPLLLKEKLTRRTRVAVALGLAGLSVFAWHRGRFEAASLTGVLLMLGSISTFALYMVMSKRCLPVYGPWVILAAAALSGSLLLLPAAWLLEGAPWAGASARAWAVVPALGVVGTAGAYAALFAGLRRVEASRGSLFFFLKPPLAAAFAWALLGETLDRFQLAGALLVCASLAVCLWPARRLARGPAPSAPS